MSNLHDPYDTANKSLYFWFQQIPVTSSPFVLSDLKSQSGRSVPSFSRTVSDSSSQYLKSASKVVLLCQNYFLEKRGLDFNWYQYIEWLKLNLRLTKCNIYVRILYDHSFQNLGRPQKSLVSSIFWDSIFICQ